MQNRRRLYSCVIGTAAFFCGWPAGGIGADTGLPGPRLRSAEEIFDFGYAPQRSQVAHAFWLRNTGTEPAVIERVKTNCGCTQAPLADSVIGVGESTWVEIILGTGRMIGPVEKYTRIFSNAVGRVPAFTIRAHVLSDTASAPPLSASPATAFIDPADPPELVDGAWEYRVTLRNASGQAGVVRAVDIPAEFVRLSESEFTLGADGEHTVRLRVDPAILDLPFARSITFELSDAGHTRLTVPVGKQPEY